MEGNVRISVIIPVYNAGDCLARAVTSVCMQDFESYEIILVNDGSTDDSGRICDELSAEYGSVKVVHKANGGVSSARNTGIEVASGEFIMFLDADDVICDGALSRMYLPEYDMVMGGFEKLESTASVNSYCPSSDASYIGKDQICTFLDRIIARDNTYLLNSACFKLFRRSLIERHSVRFVEGLSYAEDKIFVMTYLSYVSKVATVASIVYGYIVKAGSLSSDMSSDRHIMQVFRLLEEYKPLLERLNSEYAASAKLRKLYHEDLVGRYVCRILTIFCKRKSELLTYENLEVLYDYMDGDDMLGLFSLRPGQIPNILLYQIGSKAAAIRFYRVCSSIYSFLKG